VKLSSTPPKKSTKHESLGTSWWTLSKSQPSYDITLFRRFKSHRAWTIHGLPPSGHFGWRCLSDLNVVSVRVGSTSWQRQRSSCASESSGLAGRGEGRPLGPGKRSVLPVLGHLIPIRVSISKPRALVVEPPVAPKDPASHFELRNSIRTRPGDLAKAPAQSGVSKRRRHGRGTANPVPWWE
jgi:hypothetical protein